MIIFQTIAVALAMFSALPVPQFDWNEKKYAVCALRISAGGGNLRGAVVPVRGAAAARCGPDCRILSDSGLVTGGIHLDGYADTCDALASCGDTAKKLAILKDPHCGAFAVIRLCSYFAAYLMLCACVQFTPRTGALWTLALMGERMLSGLAVAAFPLAKNTGLAHTFATAADRRTVCRVLAAGCLLWAVGILPWAAGRFCWRQGLVFAPVSPGRCQAVWRYDR